MNETNVVNIGAAAQVAALGATRDVVTIIRDPRRPLGKRFVLQADGTVAKHAQVSVASGEAVMRHVPTADALADVLREVANDPHAALILDGFTGIEVGQPFRMLSEDKLQDRLGRKGRSALVGVHVIDGLASVGRFKENVVAGSWQMADRDIDQHTPSELAALDHAGWVATVDRLIPGFAAVDRVHVASASQRVTRNGEPVGAGKGHTFFKVADPTDVDPRARTAIRLRALELGLAWLKPKVNKAGAVVGHADATILDLSTLLLGRLVFDGAPTAGKGLVVGPSQITVHLGTSRAVDTSAVPTPDAGRVPDLCRPLGLDLRLSGDGIKLDSFDLRPETVIETQDFGALPLSTLMAAPGEARCQAPFRASESWAGKLNFNAAGRPFVHDVGTGTNHWLREEDWLPLSAAAVVPDFPGEAEIASQIAAAEVADATIAKARAARFAPVPWSQFSAGSPPRWLLHGVLPEAGLGVLFGESGSGKTFFVLDMVAAVARGTEWRGRRSRRGRVVYVCAEGAGGFRKRIQAYAHVHRVEPDDMQLDVIGDAPNLLGDDPKALAAAIGKADLIVVDTLAQVTPGANENSGEDMGKALGACKMLHQATGALVLLVHHSGKDQARGARGWSGLKGAADVEITVVRADGVRSAMVSKMKDGEEGEAMGFRLVPVLLGLDEDGTEITTCTVEATGAPPPATRTPKGKVQQRAMAVFQTRAGTTGRMPWVALVAQTVAALDEPAEGKEDRRRDSAVRAIELLIEGAFLCKEGDEVAAA